MIAVAARVQCPNCRKYCQVQEQHLGSTVQCGGCGSPFVAEAAVPSGPAGSNLWSGLRGLVKSIAGSTTASSTTAADSPNASEDITLQLDGPNAYKELEQKPTAPSGLVRLDIGSATSTGVVRKRNEDSYFAQHVAWANLDQRHDLAFLVVADGMGGYEGGDEASRMVIQYLAVGFAPILSQILTAGLPAPASLTDSLVASLKAANRVVFEQGQVGSRCQGMGATTAVVLVVDGLALISHVGDCRVYHQRGLDLNQITKDDTLVARMVELGQLTAQEALTHPRRNEVTQAIGKSSEVHPATSSIKLAAGDWLVIACDGLHAHVEAPQLSDALRAADAGAGLLAQQLVDLANLGGGSDNCTVVAVRCY